MGGHAIEIGFMSLSADFDRRWKGCLAFPAVATVFVRHLWQPLKRSSPLACVTSSSFLILPIFLLPLRCSSRLELDLSLPRLSKLLIFYHYRFASMPISLFYKHQKALSKVTSHIRTKLRNSKMMFVSVHMAPPAPSRPRHPLAPLIPSTYSPSST